eukprot:2361031-Lingulodinium_polyedra.AAC.1
MGPSRRRLHRRGLRPTSGKFYDGFASIAGIQPGQGTPTATCAGHSATFRRWWASTGSPRPSAGPSCTRCWHFNWQ